MITDVKDYYNSHLGHFYSWMSGDFTARQKEFSDFLSEHGIKPVGNREAYDLGSGHGVQSAALALAGFHVTAVDFNEHLLAELASNTAGLDVQVVNADLRDISKHLTGPAELIVCWGDTLTHLGTTQQLDQFVAGASAMLDSHGKLVLSFRDYRQVLEGADRFIPVKSDNDRILTCFIEHEPDHIIVTDLLHERTPKGWTQKAMSYKKIRINPDSLTRILADARLPVTYSQVVKGLVTIIATKE